MFLPFGPFVQTAYLTTDVEETALWWTQTMGAGPFFVLENNDPEVVGGGPSILHTSAYGQLGETMIELVKPLNNSAGIFDFPLGRVHHMATFSNDIAAALDAAKLAGMETASQARFGSLSFAFVDARAQLGHYIEVYERTADLEGFYAMIAGAADGWDGADPVRPFAL